VNTGPYFLPGSSDQRIAGAINVVVTSGPGYTCSWSITTTAAWIHILSLTITGSGSIPFTLDTNNSAAMRNDVITFTAYGLQNPVPLPIYQLAGNCAYTLSPPTIEIPVGGSTNGVLQVATGCSWSIASNQGWLSFTLDSGNLVSASDTPVSNHPAATNYGNGKAGYTVAPNGCATPRSASLTVVTGMTGIPSALAISQDGSPNNLALTPAALTPGFGGATGRVTVTTGDGCAWNAVSNANWLGFTGASSGSGPGSFVYSVQANTGPARTGSIQVGSQTFSVTQQAAPVPSPQLTAVENGASDALGVVSPGEIVTFWGVNLGPALGVRFQLSADGKSIPNTLAGVVVLFDGTPGTLLYVSAVQINAIVPYRVAGNPNTVVAVQYQGQTSNAMTVPVQAATPGIFSQDNSGSGPGAILNQDSSLNSPLSPAKVGSTIQIFATGGGVTSPAQTDGVLVPTAPPFPLLATQPGVTIGGLPAKVDYAGAAPGEIAGLTQINAEVPAGVAPGRSVPVVVQVGNWQSQAGLTIAVQ
jgi:uncharacterized protein (TIGR03437 family)